MPAYLIEQLWADSMENHPANASGWMPIGIALAVGDAVKVVDEGGTHAEMAWPRIPAGTPKRRMRLLPLFPQDIEGHDAAHGPKQESK